MNRLSWIKDLVLAEQEMEQQGMVDLAFAHDSAKNLEQLSIEFLRELKAKFTEATNTFNQYKGPQGQIKVYGVSKTVADFMLFRNGFKLIFSLKHPGVLTIASSQMTNVYVPGNTDAENQNAIRLVLKAKWGPFEELIWTYQENEVKVDHLVRYYLRAFARSSSK